MVFRQIMILRLKQADNILGTPSTKLVPPQGIQEELYSQFGLQVLAQILMSLKHRLHIKIMMIGLISASTLNGTPAGGLHAVMMVLTILQQRNE